MTVVVSCACRHSFNLKDEYAGLLVECPLCGASVRAGAARTNGRYTPSSDADAVFERDTFLLRQKVMAIGQKYTVGDEHGTPIIFVERPLHFFQSLLAGIVGVIAASASLLALSSAGSAAGDTTVLGATLFAAALFSFPVVLLAVLAVLAPKRHVTFYRDESKDERLIEVLQDARFQFLVATYTVRDARGQVLATLQKNFLTNVFRRRWLVRAPHGEVMLIAREDSIILSLLRRVLGPLYGLLRTNFLYETPDGRVVGEFQRTFTILDRYVLDLSGDPRRTIDRRIAIALGVMLDTGERR